MEKQLIQIGHMLPRKSVNLFVQTISVRVNGNPEQHYIHHIIACVMALNQCRLSTCPATLHFLPTHRGDDALRFFSNGGKCPCEALRHLPTLRLNKNPMKFFE